MVEELSHIGKDKLKDFYKTMMKIRRFDDKVYELCSRNMIPGTIHLGAGQEAVATGVCAALRNDDFIKCSHRNHGPFIAKGADLGLMLAEILGKRTGYCKGKGGTLHLADFSRGILGSEGIVGAAMPIAVGAALSAKPRKTGQVVACFFGDGASNTGTFGESLNLAAIWKAPVIFICENNLYAYSTPYSAAFAVKDISDRAAGYGLPGMTLDGMDVLKVHVAASEAVDRARKGGGPTLIECKTYRFRGHSRLKSHESKLFFPCEYEEWRKRDPIGTFRGKGLLEESEIEEIEKEVEDLVEDAVRFAVESPYPHPEEALEDVYP